MNHRIIAPAAALALLLASCATAPVYGPAEDRSSFGYSEQVIERTRYRVSYRAKSPAAAEDGALRRAAELTRQNGYDYFTVTSRSMDREAGRPRSSVGIGGGAGGRRSGVGLGVNLPIGGGSQATTARLEIVMARGEKPTNPNSYDAGAVLANLGG